jgi:hypothetical protein
MQSPNQCEIFSALTNISLKQKDSVIVSQPTYLELSSLLGYFTNTADTVDFYDRIPRNQLYGTFPYIPGSKKDFLSTLSYTYLIDGFDSLYECMPLLTQIFSYCAISSDLEEMFEEYASFSEFNIETLHRTLLTILSPEDIINMILPHIKFSNYNTKALHINTLSELYFEEKELSIQEFIKILKNEGYYTPFTAKHYKAPTKRVSKGPVDRSSKIKLTKLINGLTQEEFDHVRKTIVKSMSND